MKTGTLIPTNFAIDASGGFVNRTDSQLSWNDGTKTLSLAVKSPATSFECYEYVAGTGSVKRTYTTTQSSTIAVPAAGLWWFYIVNGVLVNARAPVNGFATLLVASVYLNASLSAISVGDERHGLVMDWKTHEYLHKTVGTRYESGLTATRIATGSAGAADGDAQLYLTDGSIWDEDLTIAITRSAAPAVDFAQELGTSIIAGKFPVYYRSSTGSDNWVKDAATDYPVKQNGAGQRISYNLNTGGTWTAPNAVGNNDYVVYFIVATDSITEPVISVMGQLANGTTTTTAAYQFSDMAFGNLPFQEMKALYKVIYRTSATYNNTPKAYVFSITDLRAVASLPTSTFISTQHSSLTGLGDANSHPASAISTNLTYFTKNLTSNEDTVQKVLNKLDTDNLWSVRWTGAMTATSANTLTISGIKVSAGLPVRVFDLVPTVYNDTNLNISAYTITNLSVGHTDYTGCLYISILDDTGGFFHIELFDDILRAHKVAHTATFNSIGVKNLIADATSLKTGAIFAGSLTVAGTIIVNSTIIAQFFKYSIAQSFNGTLLTLAGIPLTLSASAITEIAIGSPSLVYEFNADIPGSFASSTLNNGFQTYLFTKNYWNKPKAFLCFLSGLVLSADSGATQPKICAYHNGVATIAANSELNLLTTLSKTTTEIVPNTAAISFGNLLEMRIIRGTNGDSANLSAKILYVFEGN